MDLIMVRRNNVVLGGNEVGGMIGSADCGDGTGVRREDGKRGEDAER